MVDLFLTLICFSGFVYASIHWLKIKPSYAPLFSISSIGVLLFFFSMFNHLQKGTFFLIFSGFVLCLFWIPVYLQKRKEKSRLPLSRVLIFFLILIIISFILTLNMTFTVVDDYVYWGIIGKYLYINNHLPVAGCALDPRILAYTPGTSLIHYFFYFLMGKYSVHISYFAQNIILISALFVVVDKENIKKSIAYLGILIILLTLFFGSVFTKLQVDYLLSIICFSIFWIYYNEKNIHLKLLTMSMPLCFLFLIKEIGFMLGLLIAAAIVLDIMADKKIEWKNKFKPLASIILTGFIILLLKKLWVSHITAMGFVEFANAIHWESIKDTLDIFSSGQNQKGFLIFIKEVFIGPADRLNIPYLFWYIIIAFLWYKNLKMFENKDKSRFFLFSGIVFISFFLYLFLLYCLQIIIFHVGSTFDHTMGFSRYFNILFSPIIFIATITFFHTIIFTRHEVGRKILYPIICVVLIVLSLSRVEVYLNKEKQDIQVKKVSERIESKINNDINSIGIITGKNDNIANLQFQYHLLPNKVDIDINREFKDHNQLMQYIVKYDYVLLYHPESLILDWLQPYIGKEKSSEKISFLRVLKDKSKDKLLEKISIERILP